MQFSDTSTKLGLIQDCERKCFLGDGGISGTTGVLQEFTAYINQHNRKVWHYIFSAYGGWQYEDENQTDLPASTTSLVASQTSYALPTNSLTVRGVEVKDENGNWTQLDPLNEEMIRDTGPMGEFEKTPGQPRFYQLIGPTIRIFPAADYNQVSSFKVFYDRGSVNFASTDTTKTPGFGTEYHDILSIGASIEWLKIHQPNNSTLAILRQDYEEYKTNLKDFYSKKFQQMFPPRIRVRDVMRDAE